MPRWRALREERKLFGPGVQVGRVQLRVGNMNHIVMYAGYLGYEVHPEHRGHRYAARACRLLFPLARSHRLKTLWATRSPGIIASRRTCELVGGKLVEVVNLPVDREMYQRGEQQKCRYRIDLK